MRSNWIVGKTSRSNVGREFVEPIVGCLILIRDTNCGLVFPQIVICWTTRLKYYLPLWTQVPSNERN